MSKRSGELPLIFRNKTLNYIGAGALTLVLGGGVTYGLSVQAKNTAQAEQSTGIDHPATANAPQANEEFSTAEGYRGATVPLEVAGGITSVVWAVGAAGVAFAGRRENEVPTFSPRSNPDQA